MIQFISHYTEHYSYLDGIRMALQGGCRWIQLRMKDATDEEIRPIALQAMQLCKDAHATFIIDDHVELVRELGADGGTANTFEDIQAHAASGANYIGCGPFRFTTTKKGLSPILGLEGYRQIVSLMRKAHIDLPIVAIGGITAQDIPDIMQTGVNGIALSGTVLRADNPIKEMQRLLQLIKE